MEWAVLGLFIVFLLFAYIITQGTRAAIAWRKAAEAGDTKVIRDIVEDSLNGWRSQKRPREVPVEVWRGIQSMECRGVAPGFVRVSCQSESEYKMKDGRWIEVRNPLQEGFAITAQAAEMLFYELPHFRPDRIQIDVYSSYRESGGATRRDCILTTSTTRELARGVDWDDWPPEEVVDALGGRFQLSSEGQPLPVQPEEPDLEEDEKEQPETNPNGSRAAARR